MAVLKARLRREGRVFFFGRRTKHLLMARLRHMIKRHIEDALRLIRWIEMSNRAKDVPFTPVRIRIPKFAPEVIF